jgi:adenylyltransferase/sulfurtransferase
VELTNLQRQIVHHQQDIGKTKVESAQKNLSRINPEVHINPVASRADQPLLEQLVQQADAVIDASDNYETRFAVNSACVRHRIPLVSGAAIRFEGQLSVFNSAVEGSPCYHCLYPGSGDNEERCSENGILAPVVGIIGSMQALEVIKIICDIGDVLIGRLLIFDALSMNWRSMRLQPDPACPVCGNQQTV